MTSQRPSTPSTDPGAATGSNGQVAGRYSYDSCAVVWARGEIDVATAPELMKELADAVREPRCRVIVDLTEVTFMDSSGLNALALASRKADAGNGELRLVGACGKVRKVLHLTGLEQILPVHSTIEAAIA